MYVPHIHAFIHAGGHRQFYPWPMCVYPQAASCVCMFVDVHIALASEKALSHKSIGCKPPYTYAYIHTYTHTHTHTYIYICMGSFLQNAKTGFFAKTSFFANNHKKGGQVRRRHNCPQTVGGVCMHAQKTHLLILNVQECERAVILPDATAEKKRILACRLIMLAGGVPQVHSLAISMTTVQANSSSQCNFLMSLLYSLFLCAHTCDGAKKTA
jgi:hypothetical protein